MIWLSFYVKLKSHDSQVMSYLRVLADLFQVNLIFFLTGDQTKAREGVSRAGLRHRQSEQSHSGLPLAQAAVWASNHRAQFFKRSPCRFGLFRHGGGRFVLCGFLVPSYHLLHTAIEGRVRHRPHHRTLLWFQRGGSDVREEMLLRGWPRGLLGGTEMVVWNR